MLCRINSNRKVRARLLQVLVVLCVLGGGVGWGGDQNFKQTGVT